MKTKLIITKKHKKHTQKKQIKKTTHKNPNNSKRQSNVINGGGIIDRILGREGSYTLPTVQQPATQEQDNMHDDEYLRCVDIISTSPTKDTSDIKQKIMSSSFGSVNQYKNMLNGISLALPSFNETPKSEWVNCIDDCRNTLSLAISKELNSTAYMLRVLSMSLVNDKSAVPLEEKQNPCYNSFGGKIQFKTSPSFNYLTGIWERDKKYIEMIITHPQKEINETPTTQTTGRLIMGFGPSASGKTHCAAKVIQLMQKVEPGFPGVFLAIDGGLYREKSVVYQTITNAIKEKSQYTGLTNLVASGPIGSSLFKSEIIKKAVVEYLLNLKKTQNRNPGKHFNIYVPETLGSCQSLTGSWGFKNCINKYEVYKKLTGDTNWVGLMIYQHITKDKCIYKDDYKCVGTKESGETRAQNEGKEYSSGAWNFSYLNGNSAIDAAPKYRFRIHNGGELGKKSILEDLSSPPLIEDHNKTLFETSTDNNTDNDKTNKQINSADILSFLAKIKWEYIPGKIKDFLQCSEYVEPYKFDEECERDTQLERIIRRFTVKQKKPPLNTNSKPSRILNLKEEKSVVNVNTNNNTNSSESNA